MRKVVPHTVGSKLYQVEAITRIWIESYREVKAECGWPGALPWGIMVPHHSQVWRVVVSFRERVGGALEYRAVHFFSLPKIGVLPHAGPQDKLRDLRVGDDLVMEGALVRLTFAEHGNGLNSFLPLEHERAQLVDPFDRKELA